MTSWYNITIGALEDLWEGFVEFIPELVGALIVLIVGCFIAIWVGKGIAELLKRLKFDKIFETSRWREALNQADFKMRVSSFIGAIVKWILIIVFLLAAVEILGLTAFANFLSDVVNWLPNLFIAAAIFAVAAVVAEYSEKILRLIVGRMRLGATRVLGGIIRSAVWIFAVLMILSQLGVTPEIVHAVVYGFVGLIALSGALAFGLGGRDLAKETLGSLKEKIK